MIFQFVGLRVHACVFIDKTHITIRINGKIAAECAYGDVVRTLCSLKVTSVDMILCNTDFNYRNLTINDISIFNINNVVKNCLDIESTKYNSIIYTTNKNNISVCDVNITQEVAELISNIRQKIYKTSIISWPMWIAYQYFTIYHNDQDKFHYSILTVKNNKNCEIIMLDKDMNIVCYRNEISTSDLNDQISKTMSYVADQVISGDVAIYDLSKDAAVEFSSNIAYKTRIISNVFSYNNSSFNYKITTNTLSIILCCVITYQLYSISDMQAKTYDIQNKISTISKNKTKEIYAWNNIPISAVKRISFQSIVNKILENIDIAPCNKLQITKNIATDTISIIIHSKKRKQQNMMKKIFSCNNYNFNVTYINGTINANGKAI